MEHAGTDAPAHGGRPGERQAPGAGRVAKSVHCKVCGCAVDGPTKGAPRSLDQLRRFFAVIRAAFHHWPETSARQFANEEELRAYVQMKAGYREIAAKIPLAGVNSQRALILVEAAIRAAGSYAMPVLHNDELVIFKPRSISFAKLGHTDFCRLNDAVETVIEQEVGVPVETLLKEHEGAV